MERLNLNLTRDFMDTAAEAVNNLQLMSKELERLSMSPKIFPTGFGAYLEQLSHQMYRDANDLASLSSLYGDI
jgi:hypothetical protein